MCWGCRSQARYGPYEKLMAAFVALVLLFVIGEELWTPAGGARSGNGTPRAGRAGGARGEGCPSVCSNGKAIDNSVCPRMSGDSVDTILGTIDPNSVVWEWGQGASAVYFGQCVKEWNVMISDPDHCSDIQSLKVKEE